MGVTDINVVVVGGPMCKPVGVVWRVARDEIVVVGRIGAIPAGSACCDGSRVACSLLMMVDAETRRVDAWAMFECRCRVCSSVGGKAGLLGWTFDHLCGRTEDKEWARMLHRLADRGVTLLPIRQLE